MVLVDELLIPHPDGPVSLRLDERVTVVTGVDAASRTRLADLLVTGLAGAGPATVLVRDDLGRRGRIEPGTTADDAPAGPEAVAEVARLVVVGPADLGLGDGPPDAAVAAERAAATLAHRELERELATLEAGAAERSRLVAELGGGAGPAGPAAASGDERTPDLEAVAAAAPRIDELLRRRQAAEDTLDRTAAVLRVVDDPHLPPTPAAGDPRAAGGPLATSVLAALDVVRRVGGRDPDPGRDADRQRAEADARAALDRARGEVERAQAEARAEVGTCDQELTALARAADVTVGADGPGPALTAALGLRRRRGSGPAPQAGEALPDDPAARLVARRRATLQARLADLPDDAAVTAARRRLDAVADRLARLDDGGGADVDRARAALMRRVAMLRPDGTASVAPLVLDEALVGLAADDLCDLLDLVARLADHTQVVVLSGDPVVGTWARHRAERGELRLVELASA
ncbi:hypothetical protein HC251_17010 [Iamia sp. SCSIO 61187]|uniref:hypothetical protein n=1 Tax=Iamia sp. SCSIO 61187 TaxID=2722752 RepID=UPI001C627891|nr:hypothetical protein [Iamia sp. SCSIO 61187]QYG93964.1 hypothetical protein HC251_17010 [Iamia sp. SCSIO 61187]